MKVFKQPEGNRFNKVAQLGEYCIYEYSTDTGRTAYTYWYGDEDSQYVSSLETLEAAEAVICMDEYKTLQFHTAMVHPTDPNNICVLLTQPYSLPVVCRYINVSDGYLDQLKGSIDDEVCISIYEYFRRKDIK